MSAFSGPASHTFLDAPRVPNSESNAVHPPNPLTVREALQAVTRAVTGGGSPPRESRPARRYWHDSVFVTELDPGPRVVLSGDDRAILRAQAEALRRGRKLTRAFKDVARTMLSFLGADGRCDPSQKTIAKRADCAESTVSLALKRLHEVGVLNWRRRTVRTPAGTRQTSNAYVLGPLSKDRLFELLNEPRKPGTDFRGESLLCVSKAVSRKARMVGEALEAEREQETADESARRQLEAIRSWSDPPG